jgi:hypothetical protein
MVIKCYLTVISGLLIAIAIRIYFKSVLINKNQCKIRTYKEKTPCKALSLSELIHKNRPSLLSRELFSFFYHS